MAETKAALIDGRNITALSRLSLDATASHVAYDERWLQELLHRTPDVLPIDEIEPGFGRLLSVAMEVPCPHGFIDNLFVTAEGGIAVVETKLWRNPEARRKVVVQALDYVAALSRMTYPEFEEAILKSRLSGAQPKPPSLYSIIAECPDAPSEQVFIDGISGNLRRGRMLVIAAGDGIRSEAETLAELLQSHAGARFTFALVAIELFSLEGGRVLAVPKTLAKTVLIERGVVRVDDARIIVEPAPTPSVSSGGGRTSMTEELFFERMKTINPALPISLRAFLDRIETLDVEPDWLASLNFKWSGWPDGPVNLGYITQDGILWTEAPAWRVGRDRARSYLEEVAAIIGGQVTPHDARPYVASGKTGKAPRIDELLPQHAEAWASAMERFIERLRLDHPSES